MPQVINNELQCGYTHYFKLTAAEIVALGAGNQITIGQLPTGAVVNRCAVFKNVPFTGSSTNVTIDVGVTGADPDDFIDAYDVDLNTTRAAFNTGDVLVTTAANYYINDTASTVPILAEVNGTLTTAGLATGELVIAWNQIEIGQLV